MLIARQMRLGIYYWCGREFAEWEQATHKMLYPEAQNQLLAARYLPGKAYLALVTASEFVSFRLLQYLLEHLCQCADLGWCGPLQERHHRYKRLVRDKQASERYIIDLRQHN